MRGAQRHDVFVAGAAALFLCAHLALLRPQIEDIDSINFALAATDFDLARHQPHPPGYPVFVLTVRALAAAAQPFAGSGLDAALLALVHLSAVGGAAAILLTHRVWLAIGLPPLRATCATMLCGASPLVWVQAARPLSDMAGLAAALAAQLLLLRSLGGASHVVAAPAVAGLVTGLVAGVRSQVAWLTLPLLLVVTLIRIRRREWLAAGAAVLGAAAGALAWFVPLVVLSGGLERYLGLLDRQAEEDFAGVRMLATDPGLRLLLDALHHTFVAPWGSVWLAVPVIACAVAGAAALARRDMPTLAWMAILWAPYAVLHLLFQETETIRYALPLLPVLCALAVSGHALLPTGVRGGVAVVVVTTSLALSLVSAWQYRQQPQELFVRAPGMVADDDPSAPAAWLLHRRVFAETVRVREVASSQPVSILAAPPAREWHQALPLWLRGETRPVWWLVDPRRGDRVAIDPGSQQLRAHVRWPSPVSVLLGGMRPHAFDWYEVSAPSWVLGEGWALTPELAGLAHVQRAGPSTTGADAHVRRVDGPLTLLVGGRHVGGPGSAALTLDVSLGERWRDRMTVEPGAFQRVWTVAPGALAADTTPYESLVVRTQSAPTAAEYVLLEQFDAQPAGVPVVALASGWFEPERDARSGRTWRWMSDHAAVEVWGSGCDVDLDLQGTWPRRLWRSPTLTASVDGVVVWEGRLTRPFAVRLRLPSRTGPPPLRIDLSVSHAFIGGEGRRSADARRLSLEVHAVSVSPSDGRRACQPDDRATSSVTQTDDSR
jgi:hypothetical protein